MELIGRCIDEGVQAVKARDEATLDRIAAEVAELATQFPAPGISLDSLYTTPEMAARIATAIQQRLTVVLKVAEQALETHPSRSTHRVF
jgi:hypothetical protein